MSDFDVAIPKATTLTGSSDADGSKHNQPHWSHVAQTLLDNQLAYCELTLLCIHCFVMYWYYVVH